MWAAPLDSKRHGNLDELFEHVLGQDVGVARLGALVGRHVDVRGAQVQVGGRDGAHAPVRLGGVGLLLVGGGGGDDELLAVHVGRARRHRVELRRLLGVLGSVVGGLLLLLRIQCCLWC